MDKVSLTPDEPEFSQRHDEAVERTSADERELQTLRVFIRTQVISYIDTLRNYVAPELIQDEIEELTQIALYRYWKHSREKYIQYPRAYVKMIIYSLVIDMTRRPNVTVGLPVDVFNELPPGAELITSSNVVEPAFEIECKEALIDAIGYIQKLSRAQKQAMMLDIKIRTEDDPPIVEFLREYGLDVNNVQLPVTDRDLKNHQASLHLAKSKLRNMRKENDYK